MEKRLIDANSLENQFLFLRKMWSATEISAVIDEEPTVDAVEVVHAKWIPLEYDGYADGNPVWDLWECSECQEEHSGDEDTLTNYCPNCGAKMDGDGNG